jgi:hypothetical protein
MERQVYYQGKDYYKSVSTSISVLYFLQPASSTACVDDELKLKMIIIIRNITPLIVILPEYRSSTFHIMTSIEVHMMMLFGPWSEASAKRELCERMFYCGRPTEIFQLTVRKLLVTMHVDLLATTGLATMLMIR